MALTLADYLRQHPQELDEKSIALSETTAFTSYFERVWHMIPSSYLASYCIAGPCIGERYGSRWPVSIGNFW